METKELYSAASAAKYKKRQIIAAAFSVALLAADAIVCLFLLLGLRTANEKSSEIVAQIVNALCSCGSLFLYLNLYRRNKARSAHAARMLQGERITVKLRAAALSQTIWEIPSSVSVCTLSGVGEDGEKRRLHVCDAFRKEIAQALADGCDTFCTTDDFVTAYVRKEDAS